MKKSIKNTTYIYTYRCVCVCVGWCFSVYDKVGLCVSVYWMICSLQGSGAKEGRV